MTPIPVFLHAFIVESQLFLHCHSASRKVLVEVSACSFFRRHYTTFILLLCWYVFVRLCFTQYNKSSRQKVHWLSLLENKTHMRSKQHLRLLWNFASRNDKSLKEWWKISCTELIHHLSKLSICFSFGCIFPDTDKKYINFM